MDVKSLRRGVNTQPSSRITIDPQDITHVFLALTPSDAKYGQLPSEKLAAINRQCQPDIWKVDFSATAVIFVASARSDGYPDPVAVLEALRKAGVPDRTSVVVNKLACSLEDTNLPVISQGQMALSASGFDKYSKVYTGFAFRDEDPRLILAYQGVCIANVPVK